MAEEQRAFDFNADAKSIADKMVRRHPHVFGDASFDDEYFAQLTAEKLVTKMRGTRPYAEWQQIRPRNEALDCWKYALAALRLSGIDLRMRAAIEAGKEAAPTGPAIRRLGRVGRAGMFNH